MWPEFGRRSRDLVRYTKFLLGFPDNFATLGNTSSEVPLKLYAVPRITDPSTDIHIIATTALARDPSKGADTGVCSADAAPRITTGLTTGLGA